MFTFLSKIYDYFLKILEPFAGLGSLALRLFLFIPMLEAGWRKITATAVNARFFESQGIPLPEVSVYLVGYTEFIGGVLLLIGLATRLIAVPLMITMFVAGLVVHADNGWLAISDGQSWLANERVMQAQPKKAEIKRIVREHGDYRRLTSNGSITILNNGIQYAATYFVMLLVLMFIGGGRYVSVDYWIMRLIHGREPHSRLN